MLILESTLTCPHCGHISIELMPTDTCVFFHECAGCHERLRPKPGDCCVFCSFGSVKCPFMQQAASRSTSGASPSP
jgi:hypothetical protein